MEKRTERLHLEEELAVAEAREKAYAEVEEGAMGEKASIHGSPTAVQPQAPQPQPCSHFNPFAPEFRVARDSDQSASSGFQEILKQQNRMTEMLVQQYQQSLLPSLRITKFTGDPLEFSTFIRSFESQTESKVKPSDVCLRYLEQYLEGEPRELIKGCLYLDKLNGYLEAKKLLSEKYGDPYKISNAYIKKINEWPCIRPGDDLALDCFSTFLVQCQSAMTSLPFLTILSHPHNMQSMVKKLPFPLQDRWRREANRWRVSRQTIPAFAEFVAFVKSEAGIATDPVFSRDALSRVMEPARTYKDKYAHKSKVVDDRSRPRSCVTNHATAIAANDENTKEANLVCQQCEKTHDLNDCQSYLKKSLQERKEFLKDKGLCFACYGTGHRSNGCAQRRKCKTCSRRHPTGLHDENFRPTQAAAKQQNSAKGPISDIQANEAICNVVATGTALTAVPVVPVKLKAAESEVLTYTMLDSCSSGTFIHEDVATTLGVEGAETKLVVKTVNGPVLLDTKVLSGLMVSDINGSNSIQLGKAYTKDDIAAVEEDVPAPELARRWTHLECIQAELPPRLPGAKVGLLIGSNCPKALEPVDIVASENGGPFAVKTFAGWAIVGPLHMCNKEHSTVSCSRVAVKEVGSDRPFDHHFMVEDQVREIVTPQALNKMFELDFSERPDDKKQGHSQEDKKFLKIVSEGIQRTDDGHYEIPLPFRSCDVCLPDNKEQVLQRAYWLKRKLKKNSAFYEDYVKFMADIITKGYARKVPPDRLNAVTNKVWYIPHHGVYHPGKPEKIRVVFDCSARFNGTSLNDQLVPGPDLTNRLVGVLTRFRQEPIAFIGDIEAMFHQVRVPEYHRDFLRFLWWPDGDLSQDLEEYQMNVHLFGAVSSPSCSNFALRRAADDAENHVGRETADVLRKNFYVDDCLRSEETEEAAVQRISGVRSACAAGGFKLGKFVSNRREVLVTVPQEERAQDVRTLDLATDHLPVERALGEQWAVESDTLGFRIILKDKPFTRRGILSTICSVYDPLGIAAPFLLVGKKILQDLCRMRLGWDEEIDEEFRARWENWRSQLSTLERFSMDRCIKPVDFGTVVSRQLHSFSDACSSGYGQVTYLRIENGKGDLHCSFLMGKARLAPVKTMTIPRLELTAATVSVQVGKMIRRELDVPIDSETFWTDSTTVLKYLRNETRRF